MPDLDRLRDLGDQLRPPAFDDLVTTARRRDRRSAAVTTAIVAVALLVGGGLFATVDGDRAVLPADDPSLSPSREPSPSPSEVTFSPGVGEVMVLEQGAGEWAVMREGRYEVRVSDALSYQVEVPDGWEVLDGRYLNSPPSNADEIFFVAGAPAEGTGVPRHPCRDHASVAVGPSVADLAEAVRRQPVLDVSRPVPVTVDGHEGLFLEVGVGVEFDATACVEGEVAFFLAGADAWAWAQGYVAKWWILDVDGDRVVVMAQCDVPCSEPHVEAMTTMAESLTFTQTR
jgi:hypothetical protein